jgi:hypothetical protein
MTDLKVVHEVGVLWLAGDYRVFLVPSGRAGQQGSGEVSSRHLFERGDASAARVWRRLARTLMDGLKRDGVAFSLVTFVWQRKRK